MWQHCFLHCINKWVLKTQPLLSFLFSKFASSLWRAALCLHLTTQFVSHEWGGQGLSLKRPVVNTGIWTPQTLGVEVCRLGCFGFFLSKKHGETPSNYQAATQWHWEEKTLTHRNTTSGFILQGNPRKGLNINITANIHQSVTFKLSS